jgi:hypothetical protein
MSDATFRARLKTILDGVATAKNVNDTIRYFNTLDSYTSAFRTANSVIHCWLIDLAGISPERPSAILGGGGIEILQTYTYNLLGYYGLDDSARSQKVFVPVVEAVVNALNNDDTLHTSGATYREALPARAELDYVLFGGVLCHRATVVQTIVTKVNT